MAYCGFVNPAGHEIRNSTFVGNGTAACSTGKKVMSCHVAPSGQGVDLFRSAYPAADGQSCQCADKFGATCLAVCVNARPNYEVEIFLQMAPQEPLSKNDHATRDSGNYFLFIVSVPEQGGGFNCTYSPAVSLYSSAGI